MGVVRLQFVFVLFFFLCVCVSFVRFLLLTLQWHFIVPGSTQPTMLRHTQCDFIVLTICTNALAIGGSCQAGRSGWRCKPSISGNCTFKRTVRS